MPYQIKKIGTCYQVSNKITGKIHAKCTTLKKAKAQIRLMEMMDNKGKGIENNIYDNNIMSKQQLQERIREILTDSAKYEQPQLSLFGGKAKKDMKPKRPLTEWQKCVKRYGGVQEAKKHYNKNTKKCEAKPKAPKKAPKRCPKGTRKSCEAMGGSIFGDMVPFGKLIGLGFNDEEANTLLGYHMASGGNLFDDIGDFAKAYVEGITSSPMDFDLGSGMAGGNLNLAQTARLSGKIASFVPKLLPFIL